MGQEKVYHRCQLKGAQLVLMVGLHGKDREERHVGPDGLLMMVGNREGMRRSRRVGAPKMDCKSIMKAYGKSVL